jgi:hypothetical protein
MLFSLLATASKTVRMGIRISDIKTYSFLDIKGSAAECTARLKAGSRQSRPTDKIIVTARPTTCRISPQVR